MTALSEGTNGHDGHDGQATPQTIPWYIIHPAGRLIEQQRQRSFGGMFDLVHGLALIFTALVAPFEVGYLEVATRYDDPLFLVSRVIDVIFITDGLRQLVTMKPIRLDKGRLDKGMRMKTSWETDVRVLAADYLRSWFIVDVGTIVPSLLDVLPVVIPGSSNAGPWKTLKMFRAIHLVRLLPSIKSSLLASKATKAISLSSISRTLLLVAIQSLVLCHWYACILAISTTLADSPVQSWLGTHGYCTADGLDDQDAPILRCVDLGFRYLKTLRWSMGLVFATSGFPMTPPLGPLEPYRSDAVGFNSDFTTGEEIMLTVLKLFGIGFWTLSMSRIIRSVMLSGDPSEMAYTRDMDAVNRFCDDHHIPLHLRRQLQQYAAATSETTGRMETNTKTNQEAGALIPPPQSLPGGAPCPPPPAALIKPEAAGSMVTNTKANQEAGGLIPQPQSLPGGPSPPPPAPSIKPDAPASALKKKTKEEASSGSPTNGKAKKAKKATFADTVVV